MVVTYWQLFQSRTTNTSVTSPICPTPALPTPHRLTLDLGKWSAANPLRLFLRGYIEYFSASSMYAAWQAGITPQSPMVEAQLPDGSWKRVVDDMGFPAGLPRTIIVDLTGKLPPHTRRIRMTTNLQIYWDQVLIDNDPAASQQFRETSLPLSTAPCFSRISRANRGRHTWRSYLRLPEHQRNRTVPVAARCLHEIR